MHMHMHMHMHIHVCPCMYLYVYTYMYMYMYIYDHPLVFKGGGLNPPPQTLFALFRGLWTKKSVWGGVHPPLKHFF